MKLTKAHKISLIIVLVVLASLIATLTWAVLMARSQILSNRFQTAHPDLLFIKDTTQAISEANLTRSLTGFEYDNISPFWSVTEPLTLYNGGTVELQIIFANQIWGQEIPGKILSDILEIKVSDWIDHNQDGQWQIGESQSPYTDWQTFSSWQAKPISVGTLLPHHTKPLTVEFRVQDFDNSLSDYSMMYDFMFEASMTESGVH